jgi:hypothetical protein
MRSRLKTFARRLVRSYRSTSNPDNEKDGVTLTSAQNRELQAIDWCELVFSDSICGYQTRLALVGIMG